MSIEHAKTFVTSREALEVYSKRPTQENLDLYMDALIEHVQVTKESVPEHWTDRYLDD